MRKYIPYDHFAVPIQLNIRGEEKRKSWCGFLSTLLFIGLILWFFIATLVKLGDRKDPAVTISDVSVPEPPETSLDSLVLAFQFGSEDLQLDYHFIMDVYVEDAEFSANLEYRLCEEDDLGSFYDQIDSNWGAGDLYCIPIQDDAVLEGTLASDYVKTIFLQITPCLEDGCANPIEVNEAIEEGGTVGIFYGVPTFDANDYDYPIKHYLQTKYYSMSCEDKPKQIEMYLNPFTVISDDGVIGESLTEETVLAIEYMEETNFNGDDCAFVVQMQLASTKIEYKRIYMKLQDVLAGVAGIASALALIFTIVFGSYFKMKREEEVVNRVFFAGPTDHQIDLKFHELILGKVFRVKKFKDQLDLLDKKTQEVLGYLDVANIAKYVARSREQEMNPGHTEEAALLSAKVNDIQISENDKK